MLYLIIKLFPKQISAVSCGINIPKLTYTILRCICTLWDYTQFIPYYNKFKGKIMKFTLNIGTVSLQL